MAGREVLRQWFIPGDGIDRHVISTDIQRYLGNDATVRPGVGNGDNEVRRPTPVLVSENHAYITQGVQGYWIKAYRNLTGVCIYPLMCKANADHSRRPCRRTCAQTLRGGERSSVQRAQEVVTAHHRSGHQGSQYLTRT